MDRRGFLGSLAGLIAAPLAAEPQQAGRVYRIGVVAAGVNPRSNGFASFGGSTGRIWSPLFRCRRTPGIFPRSPPISSDRTSTWSSPEGLRRVSRRRDGRPARSQLWWWHWTTTPASHSGGGSLFHASVLSSP